MQLTFRIVEYVLGLFLVLFIVSFYLPLQGLLLLGESHRFLPLGRLLLQRVMVKVVLVIVVLSGPQFSPSTQQLSINKKESVTYWFTTKSSSILLIVYFQN